MRLAAGHIDTIAARLSDHGAARLALMGGLAAAIAPWLGEETRARLVPPAGDRSTARCGSRGRAGAAGSSAGRLVMILDLSTGVIPAQAGTQYTSPSKIHE